MSVRTETPAETVAEVAPAPRPRRSQAVTQVIAPILVFALVIGIWFNSSATSCSSHDAHF